MKELDVMEKDPVNILAHDVHGQGSTMVLPLFDKSHQVYSSILLELSFAVTFPPTQVG